MSKKNTATDDWKPCSPGSLAGFAGKERTRQRRHFLVKASGVSAVLLLVGTVAFLNLGPDRLGEPNFGGITCTNVRANAMQYMAGNLEADLTQRIRVHLEQCPDCQRFWKEMADKAMSQVSLPTRLRISGNCDCEACRRRELLAMPNSGKPVAEPAAVDQRLALSR
jgi:hypothetical protein